MKLRNLTKGEFYLLSLSVILLNSLDLILTLIGINLFGTIELNPLYQTFNAFNMGFKILSITAFVTVFNVVFNKVNSLKLSAQIMILTLTFIYSGVLLNNLIVVLV